jgi:uncharacterized protein (DUF983 family)
MNDIEIVFAFAAALFVLAMLGGLGVVLALAMAREAQTEDGSADLSESRPVEPGARGWTALRRALGKRCPRCGRGRVFDSYFKMNPRCGECGAVFWVDQGEWLGPFMLDYTAATTVAVIVWGVIELALPRISMAVLLVVLCAVVVASLFASFPWSRCLWTVFLYLSGAMGARPISAEAGSHLRGHDAPRS